MPVSPVERREFRVRPRGAYSLERTAARLVRFPEVVDRFEDGVYRRLMPTGSGLVRVSVAQRGPPSRAELRVRLEGRGARSPEARAAAERVLDHVLGIGSDVQGFYTRFRGDPLLGEAIRRHQGLRVAGAASLWESLVTAVLSQQVNLVFAYSIRSELAETFGRRARFDGETFLAFPLPERVARESEARLRQFRLSRAKAGTLLRLARAFRDGSLDETVLAKQDDDEVIQALTALKGVGRWTAEVALMRGLGRPDAFPGADLGVVKYLAREILGRPAHEARMRRLARAWSPHRSLALIYLYAEMARRRAA